MRSVYYILILGYILSEAEEGDDPTLTNPPHMFELQLSFSRQALTYGFPSR